MEDLYNKLGKVLISILLYGDNITSITRPEYKEGVYYFNVTSEYVSKQIEIPIRTLNSLHDYKLNSFIIKLMEEEHLI